MFKKCHQKCQECVTKVYLLSSDPLISIIAIHEVALLNIICIQFFHSDHVLQTLILQCNVIQEYIILHCTFHVFLT